MELLLAWRVADEGVGGGAQGFIWSPDYFISEVYSVPVLSVSQPSCL